MGKDPVRTAGYRMCAVGLSNKVSRTGVGGLQVDVDRARK